MDGIFVRTTMVWRSSLGQRRPHDITGPYFGLLTGNRHPFRPKNIEDNSNGPGI